MIAVDFSFESLKSLRKKGMRNVLAVQADLGALPFKDSIFDACLCANTLQHVRPGDPQRLAVAQLVGVTKVGGIVSVSVHHFSRHKQRAGWLKEGKPGQAGIDYIYRFTRKDLHDLLPRSTIRGAGYYALLRIPVFGAKIQSLFARAFGIIAARLGFGHMLIAVCRRPDRPTTR